MKAPMLPVSPRLLFTPLALLLSAGLTACGPSAPAPTQRQTTPPQNETRAVQTPSSFPSVNAAGSQRQRQAEFLNRLRAADPQFKTIDKAVLNEQNELGLILDRSVDLDSIPALMRTMLAQMAKEFPGEDLNVIAYAPSNPPMKIGTAHLDARSREMTYTKEHP
ncbi:MAG: hypothetical protein INR62_06120 [Rhodospirillales bacterium]|nr:hypothetical protein [Acetobacter sp.]